jgi:hypothetical protein
MFIRGMKRNETQPPNPPYSGVLTFLIEAKSEGQIMLQHYSKTKLLTYFSFIQHHTRDCKEDIVESKPDRFTKIEIKDER